MDSKKRKASEDLKPYFSSDKLLKNNSLQQKLPSLTSRYHRKVIESDGNCLFRALSYSLYENETEHSEIRKKVCKYMLQNRSDFDGAVIDMTFNGYGKYMENETI